MAAPITPGAPSENTRVSCLTRLTVAVVVGDVGQGNVDVGGQPESGFVTDRDFPDVQLAGEKSAS
jgi:hypothetical protein